MGDFYLNACMSYYPRFYTKDMVKVFVTANRITEEQYEEITGDEYKVSAA